MSITRTWISSSLSGSSTRQMIVLLTAERIGQLGGREHAERPFSRRESGRSDRLYRGPEFNAWADLAEPESGWIEGPRSTASRQAPQ